MKKYQYDMVNFIGRMAGFLPTHREIIARALSEGERVNVNIGSCFRPRRERTPFTFEERKEMIEASFSPEERRRLIITPVMDHPYNNAAWQSEVQANVQNALGGDGKVALIGHKKDKGTAFYLNMFPQWDSIGVENLFNNMSATDLRQAYFDGKWNPENPLYGVTNSHVTAIMERLAKSPEGKELFEEVRYNRNYRRVFEEAADLVQTQLKFRPLMMHNTVDTVVFRSGHVLLIRRKTFPGKDLLAVAGGFEDREERCVEAALRELKEEASPDVPTAVLRGGIVGSFIADDPHRSDRGIVRSQVYVIDLGDGPLPRVRGRSDAKEAFWRPISALTPMDMFEDHFDIVNIALSYLKK